MSVLTPVPNCLDYSRVILNLTIIQYISINNVLCFKIIWATLSPLSFQVNFEIKLSISSERLIGFLKQLSMNCQGM